MKTQSTSSTLPQSSKESFSPMLKQLSIVPQQSGLKLSNPQSMENNKKRHNQSGLYYHSSFHNNNMQYSHYKVFFKDSNKVEYVVEVENDYEYSQTYLFVERVVQIINEKYNLSIPNCSSHYKLYFAKKNGSRNSNFPEIDMHNTNIQKAMKFHDKNMFRLKLQSKKKSLINSFQKSSENILNSNNDNELNISQVKLQQSSKASNSLKQLDRSVLTNITNSNNNEISQTNEDKKPQNKYSINKQSIEPLPNQSGFFGCLKFC